MKNKRSSHYEKMIKSTIVLFLVDLFGIFVSLNLGFLLAIIFNSIIGLPAPAFATALNELYVIYIVVPFIFFYEGIYSYRFDFWHETKLIYKGLFLSFLVILAYLAMLQEVHNYSRSIIIFSFLSMIFIIPLLKKLTKEKLFQLGLWKMGVKVKSDNKKFINSIFTNPYLGYIQSKRKETPIVFLDSNKKDADKELEHEIAQKHQVMFVPVMNNYQFTSSEIFELDESRVNLIVLQNKLNSKYRQVLKIVYNYTLALMSLPLVLPIVGIIAWLIKSDSDGPILFKQERLGADGKIFLVYKFRTMYVDGDQKLKEYLEENPHEIENYKIYCKYENDPRITKIGEILRKTSADELAQIFNVLRGEMNLIGPRPYMVTEKEKIGKENAETILKVKPGITGLWQVSGRNELTFDERVQLDKWYVYNWSLWMDFVVFLKTIKVVLAKTGAK